MINVIIDMEYPAINRWSETHHNISIDKFVYALFEYGYSLYFLRI